MKETRNEKRLLVEMPERKRPLGRTRRRLVDSIKIGLREIEWDLHSRCRINKGLIKRVSTIDLQRSRCKG
jgi:hypothetical protein